jgi:hypothetical protein
MLAVMTEISHTDTETQSWILAFKVLFVFVFVVWH